MDGATLRAYRQFLGIGQEDLVERLGYKDRRTITRWENGYWPIPPEAAAQIEKLYLDRIDEIEDCVDQTEAFIGETDSGEPEEIVLSIYRSASSYRRGMGEDVKLMSWSEHSAKVATLCARLTALGYMVRVEYVVEER